jgi:hypothetical protein
MYKIKGIYKLIRSIRNHIKTGKLTEDEKTIIYNQLLVIDNQLLVKSLKKNITKSCYINLNSKN